MRDHIHYDSGTRCLRLLDQRRLPDACEYLNCHDSSDVIAAIKDMAVRGAPALGVAAAWGCVLALEESANRPDWNSRLERSLKNIAEARPTAVNLAWAVERMKNAALDESDINRIREIWLAEAKAIQEEDLAICRRIGQHGQTLINAGDTVLTHCNAGALATAGYGTALGVIRAAAEQGKNVTVIADETRPLLQGSRLTAFELAEDNIPVKLACDNACALLMSRREVQIVITGADRIAANGDTANKIGTYGVAILAKYFNIPFYIAAPASTIDMQIKDGGGIPIEERDKLEVVELAGRRLAPGNVDAFNFAFDVTPAELITGIITEYGILLPPYKKTLAGIFSKE